MSTSSDCSWAAGALVRPFEYQTVGAPTAEDPSPECDDTEQRELMARTDGIREGEARARQLAEQAIREERKKITDTIDAFTKQRRSYFSSVEAEVVKLALSIARKILHREAEVDPLVLAGVVQAALGRMEKGTRVTMCVHSAQAPVWRSFFARQLEPGTIPEIVEDATMPAHHCVLRTSLGVTELGLEKQLKEIENGLMDLLSKREKIVE